MKNNDTNIIDQDINDFDGPINWILIFTKLWLYIGALLITSPIWLPLIALYRKYKGL